MSEDKGGALVRSPPSLVEVYSSHVGSSGKWGEAPTPHIPPHKQHHPHRNASVTKHPSGSYQASNTPNTSSSAESKKKTKNVYEATGEECKCQSWARARQLEHDLDQLQKSHEIILSGLHNQLEELKHKNRDLTFKLLMGPYANEVQVGVPLSPESDVTSPKGSTKENEKMLEATLDSGEQNELQKGRNSLLLLDRPLQERSNFIRSQKKSSKGGCNDPRQARSLDLEILEGETEELTKELDEERLKNKYLMGLVEDLKRQIREETGTWYPPPPNAKRNAQAPYRQNLNGRKPYPSDSMNPNLFKLPQIYCDRETPGQNQEDRHPMLDGVSSGVQGQKDNSNLLCRSKDLGATTLPAIVQNGNLQQIRSQQSNGKEENSDYLPIEETTIAFKGKQQHNKGKSKCRQQKKEQKNHNLEEQRSAIKNQPKQNRSEVTKLTKKSEQMSESQLHSQGNQDSTKLTNSVQHLHEGSGEKKPSPRRKRNGPGGETTQGASSVSGDRAENAPSSREKYTTSKISSPFRKMRSSNSSPSSTEAKASRSEDHRIQQTKLAKNKGATDSKYLQTEPTTSSNSARSFDPLLASSSSSMNTLASSSSRGKHRGRANKRGSKKHRREAPESGEDPPLDK